MKLEKNKILRNSGTNLENILRRLKSRTEMGDCSTKPILSPKLMASSGKFY